MHRWNRDLTELTARRAAVEAEMPEFERRASSPAATDDDLRDLRTAKGSLRLLGGQIHDLTDDYWISVLERYGVLPNTRCSTTPSPSTSASPGSTPTPTVHG